MWQLKKVRGATDGSRVKTDLAEATRSLEVDSVAVIAAESKQTWQRQHVAWR